MRAAIMTRKEKSTTLKHFRTANNNTAHAEKTKKTIRERNAIEALNCFLLSLKSK